MLIYRAKEDYKVLTFYLPGQSICVSSSTKYLGHIITEKLGDDAIDRDECCMSKQIC